MVWGPSWLKDGDWPVSQVCDSRIDNDVEDLPTSERVHVVNTDAPEEQGIAAVLNVHNFSSLTSLKRVTAHVLRIVHNMKHPKSKISDDVMHLSKRTLACQQNVD